MKLSLPDASYAGPSDPHVDLRVKGVELKCAEVENIGDSAAEAGT
jgi:hypothetical protein